MVTAMPTVLDSLRRHLLGDKAADMLELYLDIMNARVFDGLRQKIPEKTNVARPDVVDIAEWTRPSPGYEPLLMKMGWDQFAARGIAKFVVRRARRRTKEDPLYRQVLGDIRFFAKTPRQRAAIVRRAKRLHAAWEKTSMVGDLLFKAGVDELVLMPLLKLLAEGHEGELNRIMELAARVASQLSIKRGPKVSAPSAAYEFLDRGQLGIKLGPWPKPQQDRPAEYVDALTAATRKEFKNPNFDSRPAQRRRRRESLSSTPK
jgi:hypothetical protein